MKGSNIPNVTLINVSDNKITDLSPLNSLNCSSLYSFFVSNNNIKKLTRLNNLPELQTLNLTNNPI